MTCKNCGGSLASAAKFCPACGHAVGATAAAGAPTAAAPVAPAVSAPPTPHYVVGPPPPAAVGLPQSPNYVHQPPARTNGLAIAAMVLGILWLYWLGSILALIFGYVAKNQIDNSRGREGGRGMAITGIVLGWVGVAILGIIIIAAIAATSNS